MAIDRIVFCALFYLTQRNEIKFCGLGGGLVGQAQERAVPLFFFALMVTGAVSILPVFTTGPFKTISGHSRRQSAGYRAWCQLDYSLHIHPAWLMFVEERGTCRQQVPLASRIAS